MGKKNCQCPNKNNYLKIEKFDWFSIQNSMQIKNIHRKLRTKFNSCSILVLKSFYFHTILFNSVHPFPPPTDHSVPGAITPSMRSIACSRLRRRPFHHSRRHPSTGSQSTTVWKRWAGKRVHAVVSSSDPNERVRINQARRVKCKKEKKCDAQSVIPFAYAYLLTSAINGGRFFPWLPALLGTTNARWLENCRAHYGDLLAHKMNH